MSEMVAMSRDQGLWWMLCRATVLGTGVGSNVVAGVGFNGVVADVGDGVGRTSNEG